MASRCWSGSPAKWRRSNSAGRPASATRGWQRPRQLAYNDLAADRQTVAAVQAMEAILAQHAAGTPNALSKSNHADGGLVLLIARHRREPKFCTHRGSIDADEQSISSSEAGDRVDR